MPVEYRATINPDVYIGQLHKSLTGHMVDLRNTLRSLEDGSFTERASAARQNAVVQLQLTPLEGYDAGAAAVAACNRCFLDLVRAMIVYFDRMIAVKRCIRKKIKLTKALRSSEDQRAFIETLLEQSYERVAHNSNLTNPTKVAEFPMLADLPRKAALSYFSIRRCLEHHAGVASKALSLYTIKLTILADDQEITTLPYHAAEGTQISYRMDEASKVFVRGSRITLTEADAEGVFFTIQHVIAPEVRRALVQ